MYMVDSLRMTDEGGRMKEF